MASAEYKHSILWRGEDPTQSRFKPAYDGTKKVARYRRGQVPEWAEEGKKTEKKKREEPEEDLKKASKRRRQAAAVILESKASDSASSRLARLQRSEAAPATETGTQRLLRHRRVEEAVILEKEDEDEEDEIEKKEVFKEELDMDLKPTALADASFDFGAEDEDLEIQQIRRERLRERALSKRKIEEDVLKAELEDEQEEVPDEESEYESESDEDDRRGPLMKPVFVSKANRETVREKEMIEKEEQDARRKKEVRALERKAESKVLVIDKIQEEAEAERLAGEEDDRSDIELMDDDDEKNEAEEYELWKIRELKRIKRDKEERLQRQKEIEFVLKRRQMTDEERAKDDARLDAANPKRAEVKQFNFLQKYYHRGGFFQDKAVSGEEALYLRDYHEPLEEEKYDKQLLPKAMQLRRGEFGKKGQVKHSHLTDVDTTDMSAAWAQSSKVVQRYQEKMAAAKGVGNFERPSMKSRGEA